MALESYMCTDQLNLVYNAIEEQFYILLSVDNLKCWRTSWRTIQRILFY